MPMSKEQAIPTVEELFQYQFPNQEKCWEALQGKGAGGFPHGNKNLAMIGNAVVRARLAQKWYLKGGSTADFQDMMSHLASNDHLATIGRNIGLATCINPNPSQKGAVSPGLIADTVEAIIGAVSMNEDIQALDRVLERLGLFTPDE